MSDLTPTCPNCGKPVETHEMFNPPRCPVVRLAFPPEAVEPDEAIIPYSRATQRTLVNVDAAVEHIGLVLRTARREAANRVAGSNAVTHAFTYLELLRAEIERLTND